MKRIKTSLVLFIFVILLTAPALTRGAVIFSENYNAITGNTCATDAPAPWDWGSCVSETYGGTYHDAGEINAGVGRSGSGALQQWRNNADDIAGSYAGSMSLFNYFSANEFSNHYKELFTRYYFRFSPGFDMNIGDGGGVKLNRAHAGATAGDTTDEWYLNMSGEATLHSAHLSLYLTNPNSTWSARNPADTNSFLTFDDLGLMDGNWHSLEVRTKLGVTDGGFQLWVDGNVLTLCNGGDVDCSTNHTATNTAPANFYFTKVIEPGYGNNTGGTGNFPANTWQYMAFDDYVVSTTYIGPDGGDTTPPASPSGLSVQ